MTPSLLRPALIDLKRANANFREVRIAGHAGDAFKYDPDTLIGVIKLCRDFLPENSRIAKTMNVKSGITIITNGKNITKQHLDALKDKMLIPNLSIIFSVDAAHHNSSGLCKSLMTHHRITEGFHNQENCAYLRKMNSVIQMTKRYLDPEKIGLYNCEPIDVNKRMPTVIKMATTLGILAENVDGNIPFIPDGEMNQPVGKDGVVDPINAMLYFLVAQSGGVKLFGGFDQLLRGLFSQSLPETNPLFYTPGV
jgi:hypothetical protein